MGGSPPCRERYRPGCFASGLDGDILAYYCQHRNGDDSRLLGRKSAGNLRAWEDSQGVHVTVEVPNTTVGDDCLELMRSKLLKGCSAGFWIVTASYTTGPDGRYTRWIEAGKLHDVSLEPEPAYEAAVATAGAHRTTDQMRAAVTALRMEGADPATQAAWRRAEVERLR